MSTLSLKKIPNKYAVAYRNSYTLQNLIAVRTCSAIFLVLNLSIRSLYLIFPESLTKAQNFPEFDYTNWLYITVTPVFFICSYLLIAYYKRNRKTLAIINIFIFLFSLYLIACGIISSFITTSDPSNALTLYMLPLVIVSVVFVFELYETILLIIAIAIVFTSMLLYAQVSPTEIIYNELISIILLCGFYLTSRYFYSYKANYYKQVIEIREKNNEIENAASFKNQVLGMVAHDLRNPLAAVESTAMIMEMEEVDAETRDNINIIKESCVKARGIILDLLEAARNDDQNVIETTQVDLNLFVRKIIDSWKIHNETRNQITFDSAYIPLYVEINKEKFHRVMDNLISNALKFSKENDKVEITIDKENKMATIEVKDHGLGIPKDMLPHLFDRFSKAGRAGIRGEQSTGLGLSIVKQIIERHKGKIEVTSVENQGSTFTIHLPALN
ncbi:sensor histidine kinase [Mucilaginibacter sp. E4BP6]|uniref:sensor histidine kinase n=1 Tax=Mucilaginibacter sp. E4BP6 TaxID=2723089 RepID=UPI0015C86857|nr:HAMP domain-containing sensor histidine kinase [Mucilaginibacter sp. E4BP6]NYE66517.1 signal transduction histidine kinase [Mucilaginibacter sp. E4BP6]